MYEEVNIDGCRILTPPGRKSPAGATQIKSDWFSWMLKKLIVRKQKQDWWWRKAANLLAAEADKYILCDTKWNIRQHSCFSPRCRSRRSCAAPVEPTDARWRTARGWWSEDPWGSPNRPGHLGRRRWRLETDGEKEQLDREEEQRKSRSRTRGVEQRRQEFSVPLIRSEVGRELGTFSSCQRCSLSSEADFISLTNNNQPDNKL